MPSFDIATHSPQQTAALAERLGGALRPGAVVLLFGELGAGKTTFVQGMARGLGLADHARSPTFVIVHHYTQGPVPLIHADFYRLSGPEEALDLGLDELSEGGVLVIEWPERAAAALPEEALRVWLSQGDGAGDRLVRFEATGERAAAALQVLAAAGRPV